MARSPGLLSQQPRECRLTIRPTTIPFQPMDHGVNGEMPAVVTEFSHKVFLLFISCFESCLLDTSSSRHTKRAKTNTSILAPSMSLCHRAGLLCHWVLYVIGDGLLCKRWHTSLHRPPDWLFKALISLTTTTSSILSGIDTLCWESTGNWPVSRTEVRYNGKCSVIIDSGNGFVPNR